MVTGFSQFGVGECVSSVYMKPKVHGWVGGHVNSLETLGYNLSHVLLTVWGAKSVSGCLHFCKMRGLHHIRDFKKCLILQFFLLFFSHILHPDYSFHSHHAHPSLFLPLSASPQERSGLAGSSTKHCSISYNKT